MSKATKLITAEREEVVMGLILSGASHSFICQSVAQQYSISERQVMRHILKCRDIIKLSFERSADEKVREIYAKLNYLYERAIILNNVGEARKILIDILSLSTPENKSDEINVTNRSSLKAIDTSTIIKLLKNDTGT